MDIKFTFDNESLLMSFEYIIDIYVYGEFSNDPFNSNSKLW